MESHEITFDTLPGLTFTVTRGVDPSAPAPDMGLPMPPEWLTIEARNESGEVVMSSGMLGPTTSEES